MRARNYDSKARFEYDAKCPSLECLRRCELVIVPSQEKCKFLLQNISSQKMQALFAINNYYLRMGAKRRYRLLR
jgi:hypothetical protein